MMKRLGLLVAAAGAWVLPMGLSGCAHHHHHYDEERVVVVEEAPPPERVEVYGIAPSPNHVWVSGHWVRRGARWEWSPGYWIVRRHAHDEWIPGHWERRGRGWAYIDGHWR
jgi:hypothetical protein